jgi:hypothetical protein
MTIDPEAVLRDGAGFIALKQESDASSGKEQVDVYFDKVALKDAHTAASFNENSSIAVSHPLDMVRAHISLNGPAKQVETLVKQLQPSAVLGQLNAQRIKIQD